MKIINVITALFVLNTLISCNKEVRVDGSIELLGQNQNSTIKNSNNSVIFIGEEIAEINYVPAKYINYLNTQLSKIQTQDCVPDIANSKIISYKGLLDQIIMTPLLSLTGELNVEKYHVIYERKGQLSKFDLIIIIKQNQFDDKKYSFKSCDGDLLLEFNINKQGILNDIVTGDLLYDKGWFTRFGNCVNAIIETFYNGDPGNAVVGLICIAYGGYCAASITLACAWAASEGYFATP